MHSGIMNCTPCLSLWESQGAYAREMERIGTDTLHFDHPSKKGAHFMSDTISWLGPI
jgi:hypothetical protein